jgi:hypothetical protein
MHQRQSMPELRMYAENTAAAMSPTYWWQVHRPDENAHSEGAITPLVAKGRESGVTYALL